MKRLRLLLFPFSVLYGSVTFLRNWLFDAGILNSKKPTAPSICVGNLSVGGTGKTPLVDFLISKLIAQKSVVVISRGYGRKSRGFRAVEINDSSENVGDEPLLYKQKYGNEIEVLVAESRVEAVTKLAVKSNTVLLFDDAFQHRKIKASLNIITTTFSDPFMEDYLLPAGNLRESKSGLKRADLVVITKCPTFLSEEKKLSLINSVQAIHSIPVFFSRIRYKSPIGFGSLKEMKSKKVLLVTGIARPEILENDLKSTFEAVVTFSFSDHHQFDRKDIQAIHRKFDTFASRDFIILTTEKDYVRLRSHVSEWEMESYPWFYLPIEIEIDNEIEFLNKVNQYVRAL